MILRWTRLMTFCLVSSFVVVTFFPCVLLLVACSCSFSVSLLCIVNLSSGQRAEEAAGSTYSVDVGHSNYYSIELNTWCSRTTFEGCVCWSFSPFCLVVALLSCAQTRVQHWATSSLLCVCVRERTNASLVASVILFKEKRSLFEVWWDLRKLDENKCWFTRWEVQ